MTEIAERLRSELDKRGWLLSETLFNDIVAATEAIKTKRIAELEAELSRALSLVVGPHGADAQEGRD